MRKACNTFLMTNVHYLYTYASELISKNSDDPEATQNLIGYNRYTKLQDLGDKLRENYRNSIMAELAVKEISISREIQFGKDRVDDGTALKNTKKAAYTCR